MMYTPVLGAAIAGLLAADAGVTGGASLASPRPALSASPTLRAAPSLEAPPPPLPDPAPPPPMPSLLGGPSAGSRAAAPGNYELRPAKDRSGDLTYEGPAFTARVATDGTVSFRDKKITGLSGLPPMLPAPVNNGMPSLQATVSSMLRHGRAPKVETALPDESFLVIPLVTPYRPDPREGCRTCTFTPTLTLFNATGRMDLTDALMRLSGQDPNRMEKARFLTATRDLRIRLAARAHAAWVRKASADLPTRLEALACDAGLSVTERREVLEALAEEMDETPAGRAAAIQIGAFVLRRFGPEGFSPPDARGVCPATLPPP